MLVLSKFLEFLKSHWLKLAAVALLALAFIGGRYSNPGSIKEVEKVVYKDRIVEKIVEVEKKVEVEGKTRVVYRTKVITKEGETKIVEVEREESRKDTSTDTNKDTSKDTTKEGTVEKSKVVEYAKPQWKIGGLVGYDWHPSPATDFGRGLALGLHVERRLLGPVWFGVWGFHTGSVGGSISVEF